MRRAGIVGKSLRFVGKDQILDGFGASILKGARAFNATGELSRNRNQ
jgi:hypothetical protein